MRPIRIARADLQYFHVRHQNLYPWFVSHMFMIEAQMPHMVSVVGSLQIAIELLHADKQPGFVLPEGCPELSGSGYAKYGLYGHCGKYAGRVPLKSNHS